MKNKKLHFFVWGLQGILGLMFIAGGFMKLVPGEETAQAFAKITETFWVGPWFQYFTGAWEVLTGVLFIFPRTWWLGSVLGVMVMVGATIVNLSPAAGFPYVWPVTIVLGLLFFGIGVYRRGGLHNYLNARALFNCWKSRKVA